MDKDKKQDQERCLTGEIIVACSIDDAFDAWTTPEGVRSFFAPECHVELRPGGPYEIFFDPEAPIGQRGSEGQIVMAYQRPIMFTFSWNSPPHLNQVRDHRTHVVLRFISLDEKQTKVTLYQDGWGSGGEWDLTYEYFSRAWLQIVFPRFQERFVSGPIDWDRLT